MKTGQMRARATAGGPPAPRLQRITESGYTGVLTTAWIGVLPPPARSPAIIPRCNAERVGILRLTEVHNRRANLGFGGIGNSQAVFEDLVGEEIVRCGEGIQRTGAGVTE